MSSLHELSLSELSEKLQKKECSASEAARASLERIRATEPQLNACINVLEESALARAAELDKQGPDSTQPLWGIPVSLKDNICLSGAPATCGSKILQNFVPFYDAEVARRMKNAGALVMAKANMDEFAMGSTTETSTFGPTRNPWALDRVPGGSSGGSAVGVSSRQVFASLGSDTGGSIRQPAALCGCVGVKPSYGLVSRFGVVAYGSSFDQVGPLTRTVEDSARVLSVIAGPDSKDSTSVRSDLFTDAIKDNDYIAAARMGKERDPYDSLKGLRVGVPEEFWGEGISSDVKNACGAALELMEKQGAILVPVSLPSQKYAVAVYYIMASAEASTNLARYDGIRYGRRAEGKHDLLNLYRASRTEGFGEEVQRRIMLGTFVLSAGYYDAYYRKAAKIRRLLLNDFNNALKSCDILAAPASPDTAWKFGYFEADPLKAYKMDLLTVTLNLVGLPGLALPVGRGAESGLPVGMQLMGRAFDEAGLFRAGAALEKMVPALGNPLS